MCVSTQLKENVMNDELQLEVVDLGDAKEETKGVEKAQYPEPNDLLPFREIP
jgi:Family of unknown function (DUF5974)